MKSILVYNVNLLLLLSGICLYANPENPNVVSGSVSFSNPDPNTLSVVSADARSIVEWESFSIGSGELTEFNLPDAHSAILNRVTGEDMSSLIGSIESNGTVYLVNPHGILVDGNSVISVGSFLASTFDVDNQEFLDGQSITFSGTENTDINVTNYGTIEASNGDVLLLGYQVYNRGELNAPLGTAGMGAGLEIIVQPANDPRIAIVASTPSMTSASGVDDMGTLNAIRSEIKADGNCYQFAINLEGTHHLLGGINGDSFVRIASEDGLVSVSGEITAKNYGGDYGGHIEILGNEIDLTGNALIDASSHYGAGEIYIGGGFGGTDTSKFNAENVDIESSVLIDCDTDSAGNGGLVVAWADDTMDFFGTISAVAGTNGGNGGTVEVSGVQNLNFYGTVDVSSTWGDAGELLLDPIHLEYHPTEREGRTQAVPTILE